MKYVFAFVFVVGLASPHLALAETVTSEMSVEQREQLLLELFGSKDYVRALGVARGLHADTNDPVYLRAMARCHEGLGTLAEAVYLFESYLLSQALSDEQRLDAEQRIRALKQRIAAEPAKPKVEMAPTPDSGVSVDGKAAAAVSPSAMRPEQRNKWLFGVRVGVGGGFVSGTPDINRTEASDDNMVPGPPIRYTGLAPSGLHLHVEGGYAVRSDLIFSLQGRLQKVSGATAGYSPDPEDPSQVKKLSPATGAIALFGKATWLLARHQRIQPFLSPMVGLGELRHVVDIGDKRSDCGPLPDPQRGLDPSDPTTRPKDRCVDTLNSGPFFVGQSAGVLIQMTESMNISLSLDAIMGMSRFTLQCDANMGLVWLL
jgi:hypothetical protein